MLSAQHISVSAGMRHASYGVTVTRAIGVTVTRAITPKPITATPSRTPARGQATACPRPARSGLQRPSLAGAAIHQSSRMTANGWPSLAALIEAGLGRAGSGCRGRSIDGNSGLASCAPALPSCPCSCRQPCQHGDRQRDRGIGEQQRAERRYAGRKPHDHRLQPHEA